MYGVLEKEIEGVVFMETSAYLQMVTTRTIATINRRSIIAKIKWNYEEANEIAV